MMQEGDSESDGLQHLANGEHHALNARVKVLLYYYNSTF